MTAPRLWTAIGLMSGTSMDGVDAAVVRSDGVGCRPALAFVDRAYDDEMRAALRACLGARPGDAPRAAAVAAAAERLTRLHAAVVADVLAAAGLTAAQVDVIGFHGHTITHDPAPHDPATGLTWQIGDGALLARLTGIAVVDDFRSTDVAAGGQGAPLVPLYHQALVRAAGLAAPLAVLNIGGVANLTWLGADDGRIIAGDTGPGNALIDDWVARHSPARYDDGGRLAATGRVDDGALAALLALPYFAKPFPKSLDRQDFVAAVAAAGLDRLAPADGAATLTAFTAAAVAAAVRHLPQAPARWLVGGGGRLNHTLMAMLAARLGVPVEPVDALGWSGDGLEAEAFAHLAVRSRLGLPLSLPETTGVPQPQTGGRFHPVG